MADSRSTRTAGETTGGGSSAAELNEINRAVRALENEVRVLETHRDYVTRGMDKLSADTQDARDRVLKLEVKVDALSTKIDSLPTKDWINEAISKAVQRTATIVSMIATLLGIVATIIHLWH